jgi:hypothetical protein
MASKTRAAEPGMGFLISVSGGQLDPATEGVFIWALPAAGAIPRKAGTGSGWSTAARPA